MVLRGAAAVAAGICRFALLRAAPAQPHRDRRPGGARNPPRRALAGGVLQGVRDAGPPGSARHAANAGLAARAVRLFPQPQPRNWIVLRVLPRLRRAGGPQWGRAVRIRADSRARVYRAATALPASACQPGSGTADHSGPGGAGWRGALRGDAGAHRRPGDWRAAGGGADGGIFRPAGACAGHAGGVTAGDPAGRAPGILALGQRAEAGARVDG